MNWIERSWERLGLQIDASTGRSSLSSRWPRRAAAASLTAVIVVALATFLLSPNRVSSAERAQPAASTEIGFSSLEEATQALRARPGVTFRNQAGWVVAEEAQSSTVWLLTPPGHPAYPSIVKRTLVNSVNGAYFETSIRCFATQDACDKYFGRSGSTDKGAEPH